MEYSSYNGEYCYQSKLYKAAPASLYTQGIKVLRSVWASTAYFGPGACRPPTTAAYEVPRRSPARG